MPYPTTLTGWEELETMVPLLRLLSHPIRLKIIDFLVTAQTPQRVTEIVAATEGVPQAVVSQQLKILRDAEVLLAQRRGNCVYYSIQDHSVVGVLRAIRDCLASHEVG